jgi:hypothetical protein
VLTPVKTAGKVNPKRGGSRRAAGKRATAKPRAKAKATQQTSRKPSNGRHVETIPRVVRVRPLDPQAKCGAGTSVERLFRVDETMNGATVTHLVFFDRHGLYCAHGRSCPAVDDVRRANRNLDWTRKVG